MIWAALVSMPAVLSSHHSFTAEFDASKPVTLTGTLTRVEWRNPHVFLFVDVAANGATVNWAFELGSPNRLMRLGWQRSTLQVGERVTVEGALARFKPHLANARSITIVATARRLSAGSSDTAAP